ncbi:MAG: hypothetical protein CM15mP46_2010 [Alphaproteobacteria bacterium]|nr:MAG: hypothetical protein CM15mP46_2010 [Alphaproteobacteria bacterium]
MGGGFKTLHPKFMGLLAGAQTFMIIKAMRRENIEGIDLLVVNLIHLRGPLSAPTIGAPLGEKNLLVGHHAWAPGKTMIFDRLRPADYPGNFPFIKAHGGPISCVNGLPPRHLPAPPPMTALFLDGWPTVLTTPYQK